MKTEEFFELLLEFGADWKVKEVESAVEGDEVDIYVEYVGKGKVHDFAPARRWRHLDIMQYKTYLNASLPRFKMSDGSVKTVTPSWAEKHERQTFLFEIAVIETLLATKNQTQTCALMRCSFDIVNRILHKATKRGLARRNENEVIEEIGSGRKVIPERTSVCEYFERYERRKSVGSSRKPNPTSVSKVAGKRINRKAARSGQKNKYGSVGMVSGGGS